MTKCGERPIPSQCQGCALGPDRQVPVSNQLLELFMPCFQLACRVAHARPIKKGEYWLRAESTKTRDYLTTVCKVHVKVHLDHRFIYNVHNGVHLSTVRDLRGGYWRGRGPKVVSRGACEMEFHPRAAPLAAAARRRHHHLWPVSFSFL
jgi:hypothetical protein